MQLRVEGTNLTNDFARWLLNIVKLEFKKTFNKNKLQAFSNYIEVETNIPVETFVSKVLESFVYTNDDDVISIHINTHNYFVGNIKLDTLCRAINFGTAKQKGYPIFTDVFNNIAENINEYVTLYKLTGGSNK